MGEEQEEIAGVLDGENSGWDAAAASIIREDMPGGRGAPLSPDTDVHAEVIWAVATDVVTDALHDAGPVN